MREINGLPKISSKNVKFHHFAQDEAWMPTKCMQRHSSMPISLALFAYWPAFGIAVAHRADFAVWPFGSALGCRLNFQANRPFPKSMILLQNARFTSLSCY